MKEILTIMALVAVLFVSVQYAQADEKILMIEGQNKDHGIFIAIEGNNNIIMWETLDGYSEHFDSRLKTYKSGGFSLKNLESGIAVWGGYLNGDPTQYKLLILTSEGAERIVASVIEYTPLEETEKETTTRVEPKSSVGTDITKWDIPKPTRSNPEPEPIYAITAEKIDKFKLGEDFNMSFKVYEVRQNKVLEDVKVSLSISRDGLVHKTFSGQTGLGGLVNVEFKDLDYPLIYPGFCYDVEFIAEIGSEPTTWKDDFKVTKFNGVWNPNMSWVDEPKWDWLPSSFEDEPRRTVFADKRCN